MKITLSNIDSIIDNDAEEIHKSFQKFKSKKKELSATKKVSRYVSEDEQQKSFTTSDLEDLRGRNLLDELVRIIKTGKEASVYLGRSGSEDRAVKIYTDLRVRSFRKDQVYMQGRFIGSKRIQKAIDQGSERGLDFHQIIWISNEFRMMKELYEAGIPVPRPIANAGLVIVMGFIGTGGEAAPRLSDIELDKDEAEEAFRQSLKILDSFINAGKVHGDLSAFNILWHEGKAHVIDFPQVVSMNENAEARDLLKRDVESLCRSFKKHKIGCDPEKIFREAVRKVDLRKYNF